MITPKVGLFTPKGGSLTPKGGSFTPKGGSFTSEGGSFAPKGSTLFATPNNTNWALASSSFPGSFPYLAWGAGWGKEPGNEDAPAFGLDRGKKLFSAPEVIQCWVSIKGGSDFPLCALQAPKERGSELVVRASSLKGVPHFRVLSSWKT